MPNRKTVLIVGGLALATLFAGASVEGLRRVQSDLHHRVEAALVSAGFVGVSAKFSGQDGTLHCTASIPDPARAVGVAEQQWGVRVARLDASCAAFTPVNATPVSTTNLLAIASQRPELKPLMELMGIAGITEALQGTDPLTVFAPTDAALAKTDPAMLAALRADPVQLAEVLKGHIVSGARPIAALASGTLTSLANTPIAIAAGAGPLRVDEALVTAGDLIASNGVIHEIDQLLLPAGLQLPAPPTTPSTTAVGPTSNGLVTITWVDGTMTLIGAVASTDVADQLTSAAATQLGAGNIANLLTIDPAATLTVDDAAKLSLLIGPLRSDLSRGEIGWNGSGLYANGQYTNELTKLAFANIASGVGAATTLDPRPQATASQATSLTADLNALVTAEPVQFESNTGAITPASLVTIERLAGMAQRYAGTKITISGYTDTQGDAANNQKLSEDRARAVLISLVVRGIRVEALTSQGFGETQPVLDNGVENPDRSRRVVFDVVAG